MGAVKAWIRFLFFGRGMLTDGAGLSVVISVTRSESPGAIWDNSWQEPSRKRENIAVAAALSFVNCGVQIKERCSRDLESVEVEKRRR